MRLSAIVPPPRRHVTLYFGVLSSHGLRRSQVVPGPMEEPEPEAVPAAAVPNPSVLVAHENRGLNPYIKDVARPLAKEGFLAFAPDALHPLGGYPGNSMHMYPKTNHGFHNDATARYDKQAAELAWKRTLEFLKTPRQNASTVEAQGSGTAIQIQGCPWPSNTSMSPSARSSTFLRLPGCGTRVMELCAGTAIFKKTAVSGFWGPTRYLLHLLSPS